MMASYCLAFGIMYWVRLVGLYEGPLWRFDLMPVHWQIGALVLAVMFPFASIGLWTMASWGPVIWFLCAAIEAVMYGAMTDLFGSRVDILAVHALFALVYSAMRLHLLVQTRRANLSAH